MIWLWRSEIAAAIRCFPRKPLGCVLGRRVDDVVVCCFSLLDSESSTGGIDSGSMKNMSKKKRRYRRLIGEQKLMDGCEEWSKHREIFEGKMV